MNASAKERRDAIIALASTSKRLSVDNLAHRFRVTPSTIRRDLSRLESSGFISRTYGGAQAVNSDAELSLSARLGDAPECKRAIARRALDEITEGETVLLDAGTTVAALAYQLRGSSLKNLRVVCAGVTCMTTLVDVDGIELTALGGQVRSVSQGLVGPLAEMSVERMTFDKVFLGADAVHPVFGLNEAHPVQTNLKELICSRAGKVYVLAHNNKFDHFKFHSWAPLEPPWTLITDSGIDAEKLGGFRENGVDVILAPRVEDQ